MDTEKKRLLEIIRKIRTSSFIKILDIGCGFGNNMRFIREAFSKNVEIEGVDINEYIVKENR